MRITHALLRAIERCPGVCPGILLRGLKHAILSGDENLARYLGSSHRDHLIDLYFFRLPDGRGRYALSTSLTGFIVTIIEPGGTFHTGKGRFVLGENGLEKLQ